MSSFDCLMTGISVSFCFGYFHLDFPVNDQINCLWFPEQVHNGCFIPLGLYGGFDWNFEMTHIVGLCKAF